MPGQPRWANGALIACGQDRFAVTAAAAEVCD